MADVHMKELDKVQRVKTVCNMCNTRCGIDVYVRNGEIVKVEGMQEHPYNRLCVKAQAIPELVHSSERLTDPLRRVKHGWQKISWDEAFDYIGNKLGEIKQKYGAKSLVVHIGHPFIATHTEKVIRRFTDLYGTPNYTTGASFCFLARTIGHSLTCGAHISPDYSANTRCMVLWGFNPKESFPVMADDIHASLGREAKLIVIDPRKTPLAKKADIYAQIRPGTDCALALGLLHVIIGEKLYDETFVKQWTVGFDQLAEYVRQYSPERVAEITWVEAQTIRNMAQMYATCKPASISLGISMDHCSNGIQAIRAITTLTAITGNIDVPGGNVYTPGLRQTSLRLEEKVAKDKPIGTDYPLFTKYTLEQTVVPAIDGILTEEPYPIKGLLIAGNNPILTWPNTRKVMEAFNKLDFLAVIDIFMTDTAQMADIVLPGTSFLERDDLRDYRNRGLSLMVRTNRVIEPVSNSREDWKIWAELGKRMGYAHFFPWKNTDELFEYLLDTTNISFDRLKQNPGGVYYGQREFQKYQENGFNTPSKKVEIYSEALNELGYDPLPSFHEPLESPLTRPDMVEKYPFILITGARTIAYLHSEYRNLPSLRKLVPEPLVEINPQTASRLGIANGDLVKVESQRGSIQLKAKLTEDIHPQVVSLQHGWSEANTNFLTDDKYRDPISAYPSFRSLMCNVQKLTP